MCNKCNEDCNDTCIDPCAPACPDNPCYDDCGCLNPTTFDCVEHPGAHTAIGVTDVMNGKETLAAINTTVGAIKSAVNQVVIDADDECPKYLNDKLEAGLNISIQQVGVGCTKKLVINSVTGGVAVDVSAKVSSADTTTGPLNNKISTGAYLSKAIIYPGGNERLSLDVVPSTLISYDSGNQLTIGADGGIKTSFSVPDGTETKVLPGAGVHVDGTGSSANPYVISTNPSIQAARTCFDGIWGDVTITPYTNANVILKGGTPKYRIRFDGSVEFKGVMTFDVNFGTYASGNNKYTVSVAAIGTSCLTLGELVGTADLKGIQYIDGAGAGADQIVQQYGYIIRKSAQNILVEFQSAYISAKTKTIVINFDGCVSHPIL